MGVISARVALGACGYSMPSYNNIDNRPQQNTGEVSTEARESSQILCVLWALLRLMTPLGRQAHQRALARSCQNDKHLRILGRIPLTDFYRSSAYRHWTFSESPEYLRDSASSELMFESHEGSPRRLSIPVKGDLGVLDESDPHRPHVILANYIASSGPRHDPARGR